MRIMHSGSVIIKRAVGKVGFSGKYLLRLTILLAPALSFQMLYFFK